MPSAPPDSASATAAATPERVLRVVAILRLACCPTRRDILLSLAGGRERNVGAIRGELRRISQPSLSHQLAMLRHGRLVEARRSGRNVLYRLTVSGRSTADAFLALAPSEATPRRSRR